MSNLSMFALLLCALSFSVSGLPGFLEGDSVQFSSVGRSSGCDPRQDLDDPANKSQAAECQYSFKVREGKEEKEVDFTIVVKRDSRGSIKQGKQIDGFRLSLEAGDCESCSEAADLVNRRLSRKFVKENEIVREVDQAARAYTENVKKLLTAAAEKARKEKARQKAIENCEVAASSDGDESERLDKDEKLACRLERLKDMDGKKADAYYNKYIKSEIQAKLTSNDPADQEKAKELIGAVKEGASTRGIANSLRQFEAFSHYSNALNKSAQALQADMAMYRMMDPNDPRRRLLGDRIRKRQQSIVQARSMVQARFDAMGVPRSLNNDSLGLGVGLGPNVDTSQMSLSEILGHRFDAISSLYDRSAGQQQRFGQNDLNQLNNSFSSPSFDPRSRVSVGNQPNVGPMQNRTGTTQLPRLGTRVNQQPIRNTPSVR